MTDWAVGDLAVCVDDGPCTCGRCPGLRIVGLSVGRTFKVLGLHSYRSGGIGLVIDRQPTFDRVHAAGSRYASADRFRKIRPDEQEACEEEFVTLLKRSKQRVSA